jgi:hypothetical protein
MDIKQDLINATLYQVAWDLAAQYPVTVRIQKIAGVIRVESKEKIVYITFSKESYLIRYSANTDLDAALLPQYINIEKVMNRLKESFPI